MSWLDCKVELIYLGKFVIFFYIYHVKKRKGGGGRRKRGKNARSSHKRMATDKHTENIPEELILFSICQVLIFNHIQY